MKIQQSKQHLRRANQHGLTLIELVVVLAVLVALAGLIVTNFPGIISRAHTATCSTTTSDLDKTMQYSFTTSLKYPSGYDSLLNDDGSALFEQLPGWKEGVSDAGGALAYGTVTVDQAKALAAIGVTYSYNLKTNASDATWTVTDTLTASNSFAGAAAAVPAAIVTPTIAKGIWPNLDTNGAPTFVAFGVGSYCTAVGPGKLLQEAPTHTGDDADMDPTSNYQRFAVVFEITTGDEGPVANYVGAAAIHDDGLASTEAEVAEYHSIRQ